MSKNDKLQVIYDLIEKIREFRKQRKDDFTPSVFIWQMMNEIADEAFLDKLIARIQKHLELEEQWVEDDKIISLDDFRNAHDR